MTDAAILGGRYELGEVLGSGGMAEVHLGRDVRLGREVAIKILRPDLARDPIFQSRFRREAQSAAALNHPAIVAVYDTGEDITAGATIPYIVMEYVEGQTLREIVHTGGRLAPQRALEITAAVCDALQYSHTAGIVHRDIKPGNVMLTRAGQVKVMDFGIARAVAAATATMTQTAAVIGTAQYLSPEQARGESVDARSDIYSTGCLLYELLTGQPPFVGDSPVAVAYQHVREDPQPPSRLVADVPPDIDAIVLKSLAKNPANRYQSAAEMRADINRALAGRPVQATPLLDARTEMLPAAGPTAFLPAAETRRRNRRALGWVLGVLAVLAVFVGAFFAGKALVGGGQSVTVPNVVGKQAKTAEAQLTALGLNYQEKPVNGNRPVGQVVGQDPAANTPAQKGDQVSLDVSVGQRTVTVPELVGLPQDAAEAQLKQNGLAVGNVNKKDSDQPAGQVLDANPSPGKTVPAGTKVDLVVSSGKSTVPDVRGLSEQQAVNKLTSNGFQYNAVRQANDAPAGTVFNQSPDPGKAANRGATVTIYVSRGQPSPTTTSPSPSQSPTPSPTTTSPTPSPSTTPPSSPTSPAQTSPS